MRASAEVRRARDAEQLRPAAPAWSGHVVEPLDVLDGESVPKCRSTRATRLASPCPSATCRSEQASRGCGGRRALWACGRSIYDGRSAPTVRSDATRSSWLSKLHERKEKPIERTSRARSGAGRWIAAVLPRSAAAR